MSASTDRLVSDYLDTLDAELVGLPRVGRREVLDEIEGHIRKSPPRRATASASSVRRRHGGRSVRSSCCPPPA
jgi:hypothetical protein